MKKGKGILYFKHKGELLKAEGGFEYTYGNSKKDSIKKQKINLKKGDATNARG